MDKKSKERIKQLKAEKEYDEIFREFGSKEYINNTPKKYRNDDLNKLKKEGKFLDIYNKYGEKEYEGLLLKAKFQEIKNAKGKFKAIFWKIKETIKLYTVGSIVATTLIATGTTALGLEATKQNINDNAIEHEKEIEEYNNKINEYAKEVNQENLNDVQIFMKVMDDMWGSIKGYARPKKDIQGFLELDLSTEEGCGVCRNMASDVAKKLNAINPKYNARVQAVKMDENGFFEVADIPRTVCEENETVIDENNSKQQDNENTEEVEKENNTISENDAGNSDNQLGNKIVQIPQIINDKIEEGVTKAVDHIAGNHMVTLVDIKEENITIALDPTNPGIGIYSNGKIVMLNDDKTKYDPKKYIDAVFVKGGMEGVIKNTNDYMKSFKKIKISYEDLIKKYGLEAQNKALEEIRSSNNSNSDSAKDKFKKGLQVNEKDIEKAIDNDDEIKVDITNIER